jgi:hypothetical protein
MAFSAGVRRSFDGWNGVALQQVVVVLLSSTRVERLRCVAVDEKRLRGKGQVGT